MAGSYCRLHLLAACLVLFMTVVFTGCKPGIPGRYLQMDEMADILYDYHVADGMVQTNFDSPDSVAMQSCHTPSEAIVCGVCNKPSTNRNQLATHHGSSEC